MEVDGIKWQCAAWYTVRYVFSSSFSPQVNVDYTEKMISISNYPLSAALTCAKITTAFEEAWGVVWASVSAAVVMDCYTETPDSGEAFFSSLWTWCSFGLLKGKSFSFFFVASGAMQLYMDCPTNPFSSY